MAGGDLGRAASAAGRNLTQAVTPGAHAARMTSTPTTRRDDSAVLELRRYTLRPGRRDELIELFEREFIESQEACGLRVLGTFRDLDRADHFVWLRGFADLAERARQLDAFYGGPVWRAHREAANATMIDSDDVLLLRPARPGGGAVALDDRPPIGAAPHGSIVVATTYLLASPVDDAMRVLFEHELAPRARAAGAGPIARFETEAARNEFPRLPVREGVHAFVWLTSFTSVADHERYLAALRAQPGHAAVEAALGRRLAADVHHARLAPTARSLLRHADPPETYTLARTGDVRDFDFLAGAWTVRNRRLRARGARCVEWDEAVHTCRAQLLLGGVVNVDENHFPNRDAALTFRIFDVAKRQWSIYWITSTHGVLTPPVHGGFVGDHGEFYGEDEDAGRPVKVRFRWTRLGRDQARWEQSFSSDGRAWELNWVMDFARAEA